MVSLHVFLNTGHPRVTQITDIIDRLFRLHWTLDRWVCHTPTTSCCSFHLPRFNFPHLDISGHLGQPDQLDVEALKELHLLNVEPHEAVRGLLHEEKVDEVGDNEQVEVGEEDDGRIAAKGTEEGTPEAKQLAVSSDLVVRMVMIFNC